MFLKLALFYFILIRAQAYWYLHFDLRSVSHAGVDEGGVVCIVVSVVLDHDSWSQLLIDTMAPCCGELRQPPLILAQNSLLVPSFSEILKAAGTWPPPTRLSWPTIWPMNVSIMHDYMWHMHAYINLYVRSTCCVSGTCELARSIVLICDIDQRGADFVYSRRHSHLQSDCLECEHFL